jgi:glycosyltransferase involved in cell wall biosynthesis
MTQATRPAHLCHIFPGFGTGGAQVRTAVVINGLDGAFRHTVVALNGDLSGRDRLRDPGAVDCLRAPRGRWWGATVAALARLLKSIRPDLVVTYNWGGTDGVLAARLCGIRRLIHAEDGFGPDEVKGQKLRRVLARRVLLRAACRVVCPSQTLVRIARRAWAVPPKKLLYLPNGVDTARFAPPDPAARESARRRLGIAADDTVVGSVGQLRGEKNPERLLRVCAAVAPGRRFRVLVVGDGVLRERLTLLARDLGLAERVIFAGMVGDPADCYRAMDVFALTSDTEQMPLAVLEAMAAGLPVVSTDVGDVAAMLSPENRGCVVPAAREDAYAGGLAALLDDGARRAALGRANRARCVVEYEVTGMVRAYHRLYREVLAKGHGFDTQ